MCGIVGYVGSKDASSIVLEGLKKLEYRGYDSAGIATVNGDLAIRRAEGKLVNLENRLREAPLDGHLAIGHTRWATHGAPIERNAHPHADEARVIAVVQNGIVENFMALRAQLQQEGHTFVSDTDTEVITHLIDKYLAQGDGLVEACRRAFRQLHGAHAIAVVSKQEPDKIVTVRLGNAGGVIVGLGQDENYLASDIPAILDHTQQVVYLEDKEMAVITAGQVNFYRLDGQPLRKETHQITWDPISAVKGQYRHFMQKEIYEQPQSIQSTIRGRVDFTSGQVHLEHLSLTPAEAKAIERIVIVACGTSAYAGQVGKFMLEKLAQVHVSVDYASEFRYRDPLLDDKTVVLAITQSGETADTLASMEEGQRKGAKLWSIVNAHGSMAHRISDGVILMQAGPEIGVASTKAFTATLTDLFLLGMYLGQQRGVLGAEESFELATALAHLPELAGETLVEGYNDYQTLAKLYHHCEHFLFLGRGLNYPIALEGALKLKEISYIHAEGYPAGEMKHGPIALIDDNMPVVCIATQDHVYDKMISQIEQVRARKGIVIALINEGDNEVAAKADHVLKIPTAHPLLTPVLSVIPLQLLAYHTAIWRGADVDQPRNLAKSVTVE
ncbi:MAG: glutamine--fructose-6-phosphate transaminase (isomerizing) [Anaerolineae bacterium]|nr:glutamine--fructose-6-phosphate transaminase (isomerizing) [Anaerolineales bacterium]MCQ3978087.1 glutamine--fructose-6-phosphate transaminase (isomerizing) [Anaerolineae bacterium]